MVSGERLDEIERELDRVTPATGPEEPPEDPTPDELSDWYEKAQENPEVDYWEAYFKMIEEVETLFCSTAELRSRRLVHSADSSRT